MAWRGWQCWVVVGAFSFCAHTVLAAPAQTENALCAELRRAAAVAAKAHQWEACVESLTAAAALDDAATTWGDLGLCEEQAGRFAPAHGHLRRAMEAAPTGAAAEKEPWKGYEAALRRVQQRVALVIVTTDPTNARVQVDGRPAGQIDGQTIAMEPGTHSIAARLDGYEDEVVQRTVRAGDMPNVHLWLKPKAAAPVQLPVAPPASVSVRPPAVAPVSDLFLPAWSARGVLVTLTYASMATVVVSGATAIGYQVHYKSMYDSLDAQGYEPATCQTLAPPATLAECAEIASRIRERDTSLKVWLGSLITFGVLTGAAGLAMYLDRGPLGPAVSVTANSDGGGIVFSGKW